MADKQLLLPVARVPPTRATLTFGGRLVGPLVAESNKSGHSTGGVWPGARVPSRRPKLLRLHVDFTFVCDQTMLAASQRTCWSCASASKKMQARLAKQTSQTDLHLASNFCKRSRASHQNSARATNFSSYKTTFNEPSSRRCVYVCVTDLEP